MTFRTILAETGVIAWFEAPDRSQTPAAIHTVILYLGGTSFYVLARLFLIAESLASLRALPAAAYNSVV